MFLALEKNRKKNNNILSIYEEFYTDEFMYSIEMVCKLLRWFKYNSLNELMTKKNEKYNQKSMMLEYILIRAIYLLYFDETVFNTDIASNEMSI